MPSSKQTPTRPDVAPTTAITAHEGGEEVDVSHYKSIDITQLPDSFFISIIGSRRSGKSFLCNYLLQQFQKSKRAFTHIFLISPTDSGFEGVPRKFRFDDFDNIHHIVRLQRTIKAHNKKQKEKKDMVTSRVCVILDDCAVMSGSESLRSSKILEEMALNGRHLGNDGVDGNGVSFFVLSQSLTRINRAIRLNQDVFIFNNIASARERELIMDECFFINTRRDAKRRARDLYESLAKSKDYRFIAVCNYIQNKKSHEDFIRVVDATEEKAYQLFGNPSDDEDSEAEDDGVFSGNKPRTLPGGRQFISGGRTKPKPY
jgi:hypothetical protein